jgi:cell wall-associated NlpC family hydrolase
MLKHFPINNVQPNNSMHRLNPRGWFAALLFSVAITVPALRAEEDVIDRLARSVRNLGDKLSDDDEEKPAKKQSSKPSADTKSSSSSRRSTAGAKSTKSTVKKSTADSSKLDVAKRETTPKNEARSSSSASKQESETAPPDKEKPATPAAAKKESSTPAPEQEETPAESVASEKPRSPAIVAAKDVKNVAPVVALAPEQLAGFDDQPPKVQALIRSSLALTQRNLNYRYGSADPDSGGMDCSGFIYYVLKQAGFDDIPRQSSDQYLWVRKKSDFQAVMSRNRDTFELAALRPGDLLFWSGTYRTEREVPITHVMIYLGKEKRSGRPVMVGASDGRSYEGKRRYGVSVFDFRLPNGKGRQSDPELIPVFEGYASIPGLREENDRQGSTENDRQGSTTIANDRQGNERQGSSTIANDRQGNERQGSSTIHNDRQGNKRQGSTTTGNDRQEKRSALLTKESQRSKQGTELKGTDKSAKKGPLETEGD